jgi:malate synthase
MTRTPSSQDVAIRGEVTAEFERILTADALDFLVKLHREFNGRRLELLARRTRRQAAIDAGEEPGFLPETEKVRRGDWEVAPIPDDLQQRHVEITGPVERKMMINALNSRADCFMADLEDSNSPTWGNTIEGQINLYDAVRHRIRYTDPVKNKVYSLVDEPAVLLVRPRGWHLEEKHIRVGGEAMSASLVDFGLYLFHNGQELLSRGTGPYFYLPKLESHLEARLWNDVFNYAQDQLGIARGTIKATVLIEHVLAALEMDEILYELRDHMAGLNAGRWDYIFSVIKTFRNRPDFLLPDRSQIVMTVPFMRAYTDLLVRTCHRRGAHAMGGMAAFIPSRKDPTANEIALGKVRQDKEREAADGFDGTWVAHPDLVPVARTAFEAVVGNAPHQKRKQREDVRVSAKDLLHFEVPGGTITENGVRTNINVGILYIESWLRGVGAAALFNLMEDAATAEISRSQIWQWLHHGGVRLDRGRAFDEAFYRRIVDEELEKIHRLVGEEDYRRGSFLEAREIFDRVAAGEDFPDFLTLIAYDYLD